MSALMVVLGAAVGAPLRLLAGHYLDRRTHWGTLAVNLAGSALLGWLVGHGTDGHALLLLGTGFCGALTTFSTFGYETVRLLEDGARAEALANAVVSLVVGMLACAAGWWLVSSLV